MNTFEIRKKNFSEVKNTLKNKFGEPFFETEKSIIFNADCIEFLNNITDPFFQLTLTSPPYNIGKEYEKNLEIQEYINWSIKWINKVYDKTKTSGALILNIGYLPIPGKGRAIPIPYLIWDKIKFYLNQEIIWNYGAGVACKNYLSPRNEKLLWYVKDSKNFTFNLDPIRDKNVKYPNSKKNGKLRVNTLGKNPSDVWQIAKVTSGKNRSSIERTKHPCQFPLDLVDRAILGFSNLGDIVIDPFLGSGSTLISCIKNGRFGVGIELNKDYCELAKNRIENYVSL